MDDFFLPTFAESFTLTVSCKLKAGSIIDDGIIELLENPTVRLIIIRSNSNLKCNFSLIFVGVFELKTT